MRIGIDIGSTTIKCVVLDEQDQIIHKSYERHYAMITEKTQEVLKGLIEKFSITAPVICAISGSAGMGLAERAGIPFVQEVYATKVAIGKRLPDTDVVIELGGEDAKILFLQGNLEVRMNGTCAGGTVQVLLLTRWHLFFRQMLPVLTNMQRITKHFTPSLQDVVYLQRRIYSHC